MMKPMVLGSMILVGSTLLAGCGLSGNVTATPTGNGNYNISGTVHTSGTPSSTSTQGSSSPSQASTPTTTPASSSSTGSTHSTLSATTITVNGRGVPTGEYLLAPGQWEPQAPGMVWSYHKVSPVTTILSNQKATVTSPVSASTLAVFNVSGKVLLDLYPVGAHQLIQLQKEQSGWVLQGQLGNGRYRVEYGNLVPHSQSATPTWGWTRLGGSEIITVNQGTIQSTPLKAPTVVGAINPGFALFNQQTNALIGYFSPYMNFSLQKN